ncbi:DUF5309 domain-containing protein [Chitinibacter bivalviorum]|uniref:DUF5309 domain-containing protein n=1 Tax=Chitinibacter bivalviorum TaxID=2739434 RepID=A0A7H9BI85_9NEIS|nr:DUF5309 domain-containing protein [Chitinibacter bivalviorum]QLG87651.1 DUF5309 domain-containing protein [Chitinibacter bivalviorum]
MAIQANTQLSFSYNQLTNQEDVADVIYNIAPTDTPFLSGIKKAKASNTLHEWITDDLAAPANNAAVEGDVFAAGSRPTPARLNNRTQISTKTVIVSRTQQSTSAYGFKKMLAYQLANASKELARDMEFALTQNNVTVAGNSTTARQQRGLEGWLATNSDLGASGVAPNYNTNVAPTDGTARAFTEAMLKNVLQKCFTQGGNPSMIMVGPSNKQTFSTFTAATTRFDNADDKKLVAAVDVYVSDFGTLKVVPNRFQRARSAFVLDLDYWALASLDGVRTQALPQNFDGEGAALVTEYCLEARQEKASGVVRDLT